MNPITSHRRWLTIGSGVAPLLVLAATRLFAGPGPAAASAVEELDPAMVMVPQPVLPTPAVGEATLGIAMNREFAQGFGRSPLISKAPFAPPSPPVDAAPIVEIRSDQTPQFKLTTIMGSGKGPVAVIDGRICRTGMTVASRWTVHEINADAGTVTVLGPDERVVVLRLKPE